MNFIVTGGAGFIGSHLAERLVENGHRVIIIDNFSSGKEDNIAHFKDKIELHRKDICGDIDGVFADRKIDAVFHLAAIPEVQYSIEHPEETHNVNVNGTLNLLEACRKNNVKRFILSSSTAVYGNNEKLPHSEGMKPDPLCPYAVHKLVGEQYCRLYNRLYGMEAISLRYFNVYGPRQNPKGAYAGAISKFIDVLARKEQPTIFGDGEQTRDFIFVSDVVEANMLAAETRDKACFGEAFNIGTGRSVSVNKIAETIAAILGRKLDAKRGPARIEIRHSLADNEKAKKMLKWQPRTSFEDGIRKTCDFFVEKQTD